MDYKELDMARYPRREHFEHFMTMENPFVSLTFQVDITDWLRGLKERGCPFFLSFQYAAVQAANAVPEFRQRIRDGAVVEYDFCDPSYIVLLPDGTYRYCNVNANQPFAAYLAEAKRKQAQALRAEHLEEEGDPQSMLFISCVPWFGYTGLQTPWPDRRFSVPSLTWGRYAVDRRLCLEDGKPVERERVTLPLTVMANHALVDGVHFARFLENLDRELAEMFAPAQ